MEKASRERFSRLGFILASAGSAVGLGNLWRFPYLCGIYGGGAFVVVYLLCVVFIGVGLMLAEIVLGRNTQLSSISAYKKLDKRFSFIGIVAIGSAILVIGYYPVVGGWATAYLFKAIVGQLAVTDPAVLGGVFGEFVTGTWTPLFWTALYLGINIYIVGGGVKEGIEKASKILMPVLFIVLIILVVRAITLPGALEGLKFLYAPDWSKLSGELVLAALGQTFFSLSLGMGIMTAYASYLDKEENLFSASLQIPAMDTASALLCGTIIVPAAVAFGFEVGQGPGLLFSTVPAIFATMGPMIGRLFGTLFFLIVVIAALTSSISVLESVVSFFIDEVGFSRKKAVAVSSTLSAVMCIAASMSMGAWSGFSIFGRNFFDFLDYTACNIGLPLGGMFLAIFVGWFWNKKEVYSEVTNQETIEFKAFNLWHILCKWIIPVAIFLVLLSSIGIIG